MIRNGPCEYRKSVIHKQNGTLEYRKSVIHEQRRPLRISKISHSKAETAPANIGIRSFISGDGTCKERASALETPRAT
jgi:hypothetical protein